MQMFVLQSKRIYERKGKIIHYLYQNIYIVMLAKLQVLQTLLVQAASLLDKKEVKW